MSDLVGNPEDRFSRVAAQFIFVIATKKFQYSPKVHCAVLQQSTEINCYKMSMETRTLKFDCL